MQLSFLFAKMRTVLLRNKTKVLKFVFWNSLIWCLLELLLNRSISIRVMNTIIMNIVWPSSLSGTPLSPASVYARMRGRARVGRWGLGILLKVTPQPQHTTGARRGQEDQPGQRMGSYYHTAGRLRRQPLWYTFAAILHGLQGSI